MRKIHNSYTISTFLFIFLFACHSKNDPAKAKPGFHDKPGNFGAVSLSYADTNAAEWKETVKKLDDYYSAQVHAGFNGSVLIGYKGKILYERYFGYANRDKGAKLDTNSSVQLASISKTFTGAAILYLYQQKYLSIDEKVQQYLPEFPYKDITVRMLLNHRSGLPDYTKWVPLYNKDTRTPIYNGEVLDLMAHKKPRLEFKPDTRFKYSNTNYAILALIIEEVSGMKYKNFMKQYIFDPLGMKNTFVYDPATGLPSNATISYKYNWVAEPVMFADGVYGDKGIYSTVEDMYRWDQSFYQNRLLNNETMELAYGPCSFEKKGIKNYGLGWRMLCYPDGYKIIYHNGWWHGNNTCFYRFIKENFTIIVLGNKYHNSIYHQPPAVFGILKNADSTSGDFDTDE